MRFRPLDFLLLVLLVAVAVGWWFDHDHFASQVENDLFKERIERARVKKDLIDTQDKLAKAEAKIKSFETSAEDAAKLQKAIEDKAARIKAAADAAIAKAKKAEQAARDAKDNAAKSGENKANGEDDDSGDADKEAADNNAEDNKAEDSAADAAEDDADKAERAETESKVGN